MIDDINFNNHKVANLRHTRSIQNSLNVDFESIERNGFQVVRNFGLNTDRLKMFLEKLSNGKIFYSARIGDVVHQFRVLPRAESLAEQASCGGYHTDFMFQPRPPAYIALLCLRPDPKHPIFGRNQIVHRDDFVAKMRTVFSLSEADLKQISLKYIFPGRPAFETPILDTLDGRTVFRLHTSLVQDRKNPILSDGLSLKEAIEAVCSDVAQDLVLDKGDLLIISNHIALHRRSECTIAYHSDGKSFDSREIASIRFDI